MPGLPMVLIALYQVLVSLHLLDTAAVAAAAITQVVVALAVPAVAVQVPMAAALAFQDKEETAALAHLVEQVAAVAPALWGQMQLVLLQAMEVMESLAHIPAVQ